MHHIRPFATEDIPQIAALHQRTFGKDSSLPPKDLEAHFREIFFDNPWYDPSIRSLVYENPDGRIVGFLGVLPRPMSLNGRPIQSAISTQFMVEPTSRGLSGLRLLKTFLSGPQELSMTDGPTESLRKVWQALGGTTSILYSIHWTRPLRPTRYMASLVAQRKALVPVISASKPVLGLLDSLFARMRKSPFRQIPQAPGEELTVETLLTSLPQFANAVSLRPDYSDRSLKWIIDMARQKKCWGDLRKKVVRNGAGAIVGWYLYYARRGATGEVLQVVARRDSIAHLLDHLFYDAWRQGAIALSGRLEPRFFRDLAKKHCLFHAAAPAVLIHSRNAELLRAILSGDAFLTRLEGEWWMRFLRG